MEFKKRDVKIYVLSGKAGNGKSKTADYICNKCNELNKRSISLAYASYLKEYAKNILSWDGSEDTKPREFLQQLGVELIKNNIDDHMLINRVIEDIKVYQYFYDCIVISDARFKDEIEYVKNNFNNVTTIHVYGKDNNLTDLQKKHSTEVALDSYNDYDYEIDNSDSIDVLYNKIDQIIKESI